MHILITGGIINQDECKSTEAVFRVYRVQVAKLYLHKKRWNKQVNFCFSCICICIYDVGEEEAGTLIRWWWDYMESKHPSDAANLRPALPARSFVFVFHNFPTVFLYLCTYLISLELHPDMYQIVNVREVHPSQLQLLLTGSKIKTFETWTTGIVGEPHKTNLRWNDTTKKRRHCKTQSPGHKAIWNSYEKTGGVEAGTRLNIFIRKQTQEWNWSTQSE